MKIHIGPFGSEHFKVTLDDGRDITSEIGVHRLTLNMDCASYELVMAVHVGADITVKDGMLNVGPRGEITFENVNQTKDLSVSDTRPNPPRDLLKLRSSGQGVGMDHAES